MKRIISNTVKDLLSAHLTLLSLIAKKFTIFRKDATSDSIVVDQTGVFLTKMIAAIYYLNVVSSGALHVADNFILDKTTSHQSFSLTRLIFWWIFTSLCCMIYYFNMRKYTQLCQALNILFNFSRTKLGSLDSDWMIKFIMAHGPITTILSPILWSMLILFADIHPIVSHVEPFLTIKYSILFSHRIPANFPRNVYIVSGNLPSIS